MSIHVPLPPGMTVEKEDSDSDPEAVAARRKARQEREARTEREEAAQKAEAEAAARRAAELAGKELLLQRACAGPEFSVEKVKDLMSGMGKARPDGFEERLALADELGEQAKRHFAEAETAKAILHWLAAVCCLDFTKNELTEREAQEKKRVEETAVPVLSNLSVAFRKVGLPVAAARAADCGLDVVRQLPYDATKELRMKLCFRRALAKGDRRDFLGAREDFRHVLTLSPEHEEAKNAIRNCDLAMRLEKGPKEKRWKGSLTVQIPRKAKEPARQPASKQRMWALAIAVPLLAVVAMWLLR